MEKTIRDQFNQNLLTQALAYYQIKPDDAVMLDGFESFIYNVQKNGHDFILRIGHSSRRTPDLVQGESEFLNHLARGGLSVPQVLPSIHGNLVETIEAADGSLFLTTLFEKAPGGPPGTTDWKPQLHQDMGRFMGKLHRLSKQFRPSAVQYKRFDIKDDLTEVQQTARKHLPESDHGILTALEETVAAIHQLPSCNDCYGLCHIDFHGGNFFITDDGQITLFDFDDCQYAWFIYDIAMALFYVTPPDCASGSQRRDAMSFLQNFWKGYQIENNLNRSWLAHIALFLRLREIDLYILIHRSMDLNNLDRWCASYMKNRHEKILGNVPYCDIAFDSAKN